MTTNDDDVSPRVTVERDGHVLLIGLNRVDKRNAADMRLLQELSLAYGMLERDPELRVGFVFAHGDHFTAGLDLADVGPHIGAEGLDLVPEGGINPWQVSGEQLTKPDVVIAADSTVFGQIEVSRGILPFGGATIRFPRAVGWGNAMRWVLTGETFPVSEAHRIGLVQEVVKHGEQYDRGLEIARRIAAQAPLAVQAALVNARLAIRQGDAAAEASLQPELVRLAQTEDTRIGMESFLTRQPANFIGR